MQVHYYSNMYYIKSKNNKTMNKVALTTASPKKLKLNYFGKQQNVVIYAKQSMVLTVHIF